MKHAPYEHVQDETSKFVDRFADGEFAHHAQKAVSSNLDLWIGTGKPVCSEDCVGYYVSVGTAHELVDGTVEC